MDKEIRKKNKSVYRRTEPVRNESYHGHIASSDYYKAKPLKWNHMQGSENMYFLLSNEYQRMWLDDLQQWYKKAHPEEEKPVNYVKKHVEDFKKKAQSSVSKINVGPCRQGSESKVNEDSTLNTQNIRKPRKNSKTKNNIKIKTKASECQMSKNDGPLMKKTEERELLETNETHEQHLADEMESDKDDDTDVHRSCRSSVKLDKNDVDSQRKKPKEDETKSIASNKDSKSLSARSHASLDTQSTVTEEEQVQDTERSTRKWNGLPNEKKKLNHQKRLVQIEECIRKEDTNRSINKESNTDLAKPKEDYVASSRTPKEQIHEDNVSLHKDKNDDTIQKSEIISMNENKESVRNYTIRSVVSRRYGLNPENNLLKMKAKK